MVLLKLSTLLTLTLILMVFAGCTITTIITGHSSTMDLDNILYDPPPPIKIKCKSMCCCAEDSMIRWSCVYFSIAFCVYNVSFVVSFLVIWPLFSSVYVLPIHFCGVHDFCTYETLSYVWKGSNNSTYCLFQLAQQKIRP